MPGRTIAIGDIHGCDRALDVLLAKLAPTTDDTLVVLGDVIDRGPHARQVIDRLLELENHCNLIFIMGNHEEMMLGVIETGSWLDGWLGFGGQETLESYGESFDDIPEKHIDFLCSGKDYWETDFDIFIHANLEPELALKEQSVEWLRWTRLTGFEEPHPSGKRIICGHSSQESGLPVVLDGWVCLDTQVYDGGFLTALDVESNEVFQAGQTGESRSFSLQELS